MLILGASGKLGRALRAFWRVDQPQDIEIVPVFRRESIAEGAVFWQPGESVRGLPKADVVLALWGVTGGNPQALSANAALARAAIELGAGTGAQQVLHCSSAAVYGRVPGPLREDTPCRPANAYGESKCAMERVIHNARGATQTILRIGNVAGADALFANMLPGARVTLDRFDSGAGPARSYIAPTDLGAVILAVVRSGTGGIVNVAAPRPTAMAEIAEAARCAVDWHAAPASALETVQLDTARLSDICPLPVSAASAAHLVEDARRTGIWP